MTSRVDGSPEATPRAILNVLISTTIPSLFERLPICSSCAEPSTSLEAHVAEATIATAITNVLIVDAAMALLLLGWGLKRAHALSAGGAYEHVWSSGIHTNPNVRVSCWLAWARLP